MNPTAGDPHLLAGRYRLGGLLGRGGMAEVYDGFDERLHRPVAVKLLGPGPAADQGLRRRFSQEARSAARLSNPAVVAVYDTGEDNGRPFLIMERLPGETLSDRMKRGRVSQEWLAGVAAEVLDALRAAHQLGIVHRDIKPANILLTEDDHAKVADFGIAKAYQDEPSDADLTATGMLIGTVAYLAPELVDGTRASPQSDLYALGVVLYEALAGRKPYTGETPIAQARSVHAGGAPDVATLRPDVNPGLAAVVRRAMAYRPEDRYPSAAVMAADLQASGLLPDATGTRSPGATSVLPAAAAATQVMPPVGPTAAAEPTRVAAPTEMVAGGPAAEPTEVPASVYREIDRRRRRRAVLIGTLVGLAVILLAVAVVLLLTQHSPRPPVATPPSSTTTTTPRRSTSTTATTSASTTPPTTLDATAQSLEALANSLSRDGGNGPQTMATLLRQVANDPPGAQRAQAATNAWQTAESLYQAKELTSSQYSQIATDLKNAGASPPTTTTTSTSTTSTSTTTSTTTTPKSTSSVSTSNGQGGNTDPSP